jgi:hypothetical protein
VSSSVLAIKNRKNGNFANPENVSVRVALPPAFAAASHCDAASLEKGEAS